MLDSTRVRIVALGAYGFSGKYIRQHVRKYEGELFSLTTIYKTVRDAGFRLKDYRDGLTDEAKTVTVNAVEKRGLDMRAVERPAPRTPRKKKKARK